MRKNDSPYSVDSYFMNARISKEGSQSFRLSDSSYSVDPVDLHYRMNESQDFRQVTLPNIYANSQKWLTLENSWGILSRGCRTASLHNQTCYEIVDQEYISQITERSGMYLSIVMVDQKRKMCWSICKIILVFSSWSGQWCTPALDDLKSCRLIVALAFIFNV